MRVREGSAPEILALLRRGELDVAFTGVAADALDDGLAGEQMLSEELLLITAAGASGPRAGRALGRAVHRLPAGIRARDTIDGALRAAGADPEVVFESDELVSVRELVARSLGVSIVPRSTVDGEGPPVAAISDRPGAPAHARVARAAPAACRRSLSQLRPRGGPVTIEVRRLREGETALVRDVRLRALREAPEAFATTYDEALARPPEHWAEMASGGNQVTVVALDGERGVGMVSGWLLESGNAWLARLWVDPDVRRAGVALRLTEGVAGWARERGATTLELSVTANNARAAAFYARAGFTETGRRRPLPADPSRTEVFLSRPVRP